MQYQHDAIGIPCSDLETPIVAGATVAYLVMPYKSFTLFDAEPPQASLLVAATTGTFTVDVHVDGTTVLGNKITFDATETSSLTDATQPTLINKQVIIVKGQKITIDIDDDGSGDAEGLIVYLIGLRQL